MIKVVCDETNNTPARIDANEFYVDVRVTGEICVVEDVVDKVYLDIKPRPQQSEVVRSLKNQAGEEWKSRCTEHYAWKAAEYIEFLESTIRKYQISNDPFTKL